MKKTTSVILIISMILTLLFSINISAEGGTATVGYLTFTEHDTYCELTKCDISAGGEIVIPSSVDFNGKPLSVTSIGSDAFLDCWNITSVTIPDSVTSIGDMAFACCNQLISVTMGSGVKSIGNSAFSGCDEISVIYYSGNEKQWNNIEFGDCNDALLRAGILFNGTDDSNILDWLTFEKNGDHFEIKKCDNSAFGKITIPSSATVNGKTLPVTSICENAFENCIKITSVIIPDSITKIESAAFKDCGLTSVNIPGSVTSISDFMFSSCFRLSDVTISDGVKEIGEGAFFACRINNIIIPDSITSIGSQAFDCCDRLAFNEYDNAIYLGNTKNPYHALIKAKDTSITSIEINNNTKLISAEAFSDCESLTKVTIPDGVTTIGRGAFSNCSQLESVNMPDSVTKIDRAVFLNCSGLTSVTIPASVTTIGEHAFSGSGLTSIIISNGVTAIGQGAFQGCSSLESITVGKNNKVYHSKGNCLIETNSKTLILGCNNSVIPDDGSVTSIGEFAFYNCSFTSMTIPEGITFIGDFAFSHSGLTSIIIPNGVTTIGDGLFYDCRSLTNVEILGKITSINGTFCDCVSLIGVIIPDSLKSIGLETFYNCSSLESITIPSSVTSIGRNAFYACNKLKTVYYKGSEEQWNEIQITEYGNNNLENIKIIFNYSTIDAEEPKPGKIIGDCNGDGHLNNKDVIMLFNYESYYDIIDFDVWDVNRDGRVDNKDAVFLFASSQPVTNSIETVKSITDGKLNIVICNGEPMIAEPGDIIPITIGLVNNMSISSLKINLTLDKKLSVITKDYNESVVPDVYWNIKNPEDISALRKCVFADDGSIIFNWMSSKSDAKGDLEYALIEVKVADDAEFGEQLMISATVDPEDVFDKNRNNIDAVIVFSGIRIEKTEWHTVPEETILGDIDGDGESNNKDVVNLFRFVSTGETLQDEAYDFNKDGEVNNKDVVELFRFVSAAQ